jgi:hypothetical protein
MHSPPKDVRQDIDFLSEGYAGGKKSVSLADTIVVLGSYPAHLAVYGVTSKSASLADATAMMVSMPGVNIGLINNEFRPYKHGGIFVGLNMVKFGVKMLVYVYICNA